MIETETLSGPRQVIADELAKAQARAAAARAALNEMRLRAMDFRLKARERARDEMERRRYDAANRLESFADVLRPDDRKTRDRRNAGLALTAALGVGVAVGLVVSRQLKKRAEERARMTPQEAMTAGRKLRGRKETPPMPKLPEDVAPAGLNS